MAMKNLFGIIALFLCSVGIISCSNDDKPEPTPFHLEKQSYEIRFGFTGDISIKNGSGDISVSVRNPEIVSVSYLKNDVYTDRLGLVSLQGKQKGETKVVITDNITKESEEVNVKVIDSYLACTIMESNHPALTKNPPIYMYLVKNEARDCYFFVYSDASHSLKEGPIAHGTYNFSKEEEGDVSYPCLTLTYAEENGKFTDAAVSPTTHKFNLTGTEDRVFDILNHYLNFNLNRAFTRMNIAPVYRLNMKEIGTEYAVFGEINMTPIPEGVLNKSN